MTLLPRAGLALALLHLFFCPENLPSGLSLSGVDQSIARRDGTFFDKYTGALSAYGVLIANATWAAWRTLVLLLSWYVAFSLSLAIKYILNNINLGSVSSGNGCAGLCGPRSHWEEELGRAISI